MQRWVIQAILAAAVELSAVAAMAAVPPHTRGAICATPRFWCWAIYPGRPGATCSCRSQDGGWVQGVLV